MLVLSREINESIKIGNDIEIHIVEIRGKAVKLGIIAPKNMAIVRDDAKCKCADPGKCGSNCCRRKNNG